MKQKIRPCDGFIWPLFVQFRSLRNQTVVLLVLLCPLHDHGLNTGNASCFTDFFIDRVKSCKPTYYYFLETFIEILVALNVFNIHVAATVGFALTITMRGRALNALCTWVRPLLGDVYCVPWHPRVFSGLPSMGMGH